MAQPIISMMSDSVHCLAWMPSMGEWIIIAAFGLLLFGKRLPEVGRSLGKGIVEFKKGLKGVEEDVDKASEPHSQPSTPEIEHKFDPYTGKPKLPTAYKFDPYTGKPVEQSAESPAEQAPPGSSPSAESGKVG
jgi:sec-independent protein translocase protein TatA